jgi:hypothetical protein
MKVAVLFSEKVKVGTDKNGNSIREKTYEDVSRFTVVGGTLVIWKDPENPHCFIPEGIWLYATEVT